MEMLDLIDGNDEVIGKAPRKEVEAKGLLYRASEIIVFYEGKIVVQKRSADKVYRPSHWSIVGETVQSGETYKEAAIRGVKEELNLEAENLEEIGSMRIDDEEYNDHEIEHVFRCEGKGNLKKQDSEVEEIRLMAIEEIMEFLDSEEKTTPAFRKAVEILEEAEK